MSTAFVAIENLAASTIDISTSEPMSKGLAIAITGGLSTPSKMPGYAWGTPAEACKIGSKLAQIEGSTCEHCYARKGFYAMPNVRAAYERRLERMYHSRWVEAMVFLIASHREEFFRWQDSGDLQSTRQLENIVAVCRLLPDKKFWLPTREYKLVTDWLQSGGVIPSNLVIRLSAHMVDSNPPAGYGLPTSTVHSSPRQEPSDSKVCRAYTRGNKCGKCRSCWDADVDNVSYLEH